jgi:hypothetical protein
MESKAGFSTRTSAYLMAAGGCLLLIECVMIVCDLVTVELPDHKIDTLSIALSTAAWIFLLAGFIHLFRMKFLGRRNNLLWIPISGLLFYVLGCVFILLDIWSLIFIVPIGLLLTASGTTVVGIFRLRMKLMKGWSGLSFVVAGLYPFLFMFPIVAIYGSPNYSVNYLWGLPWVITGYSLYRNRLNY